MDDDRFLEIFMGCFETPVTPNKNLLIQRSGHLAKNQSQTMDVFSEKWSKYDDEGEKPLYEFQRAWYLTLYGFQDEQELKEFLADKSVIFDAGCGLGYKTAWFAELAPHALVIGMDLSQAAELAGRRYAHLKNCYFVRGDISSTGMRDGIISFCSCDQVIMHTENPELTFLEFSRITSNLGEVACYFYAKKALPRELIDDFFRTKCKQMSTAALWEMSEQLTELGKRLSELNATFEAPEIPELGIKGGTYDVQRFIYWNFLKCFWNAELGEETSTSTNFDWYSPSNARRFDLEEVMSLTSRSGMEPVFLHSEEAAHSGRWAHRNH